MNWELVTHDNSSETERLEVPGGWIVRTREWDMINGKNTYYSTNQLFIRDIYHKWTVKKG